MPKPLNIVQLEASKRPWLALVTTGLMCAVAIAHSHAADAPPGNLGDLSIEQLMEMKVDTVFGASKYEQKVTRAPASVNIITSDDIVKNGYRSPADILRAAPGMYVTNDRNYSFLGMRGFSQPGDFNTGILLLIDGHRVNDPLYNLMYIANEAVVDVDMIDRVEIIRGPSSSVYGNSAFFGVINVITKRGGQIDGAEVSGEAGSFGEYKASFIFGKKFANDLEVILSGSYLTSEGQRSLFFPEYADPANNNGVAENSDRETAYHLSAGLSYHDFSLSAAYTHRYKKIPTAPYGTVFDTGTATTIDDRGYVNLKYEHGSGAWTTTGNLSYDWTPYYAVLPFANSLPPPEQILNQDRSRVEWARGELQVTGKIFDRHTLIFGAEYQDNLRLFQANYDQDPYTSYLYLDHGNSDYAFYSQGEFALAKGLILNAGARYDHFATFGGTTNPRLGLIYTTDSRTTFKALYGHAFRAPTDYEESFQSSTYERNSGLKPETIRTYELVCEQYLPANLRLSASGYHYDVTGLISQVTDPANGLFVFRNFTQVAANGLELQLEDRYANGLVARASYALQHAEDRDNDLELSNSPRHLAKGSLTAPLGRFGIFGSVEAQYQSQVVTPARGTAGGFAVMNATLFSEGLAKGWKLSASVYNLWDKRYATAGSGAELQDVLRQDGRSFRVKLTRKF